MRARFLFSAEEGETVGDRHDEGCAAVVTAAAATVAADADASAPAAGTGCCCCSAAVVKML